MPAGMAYRNLITLLLSLSYHVYAHTTHTTFTTTSTRQVTTLTSTLTTSTSTIVAPSASTDRSWTSDSDFKSSCLNSTNTYRVQHTAPVVAWNDSLATWATRWTSKCLWAHSGLGFGENLAEGFADVVAAIDGWGNERNMFDFSHPRFTNDTGHFSQLIWNGSRTVGCGRTYCGPDPQHGIQRVVARDNGETAFGWMLACEYWPPGNVDGEFRENVHSQVSNGDTSQGLIGGGGLSEQGVIGNVPNAAMQLSIAYVVASIAMAGSLLMAMS